jgi:hypothetical protein
MQTRNFGSDHATEDAYAQVAVIQYARGDQNDKQLVQVLNRTI